MSAVELVASTGDNRADGIIRGVVRRYQEQLGGYIKAYYVIGSYADGSQVPLSDIDLVVLFGKPLTQAQLDGAWELAGDCGRGSPIRLDIGLELEQRLEVGAQVGLMLGSRCVFGEDSRSQWALPSMAAYRRYVTWGPYRFLGQVVRQQEVLQVPLDYPDAQAPFYGYTAKRIERWYPEAVEQGTKELITGVSRTARALLALEAGQYVGSKDASVKLYHQHIGGPWADYLETLYQKGKLTWQYLVPEELAEQQQLDEICHQTLAFENYYFQRYRHYLQELVQGEGQDRVFAQKRLQKVCFGDPAN
ncbi:MAG: hypothetical protein GKR89_01215 [Candidatus Latescibacteria bacterium]|nr:hypothetical protein [Candidatus Latescibacterota bacterium]